MWFTNNGGPVKIRIGEPGDCYWATIRKGESIELSAELGLHYGFSVKTTEGKLGSKKVETKQIETAPAQLPDSKKTVNEAVNEAVNDTVDFLKELIKIKGIGRKTAEDITKIFPTREELINKIRSSTNTNALPFRDDISKILTETYGR